jgi:hypothetical protein
MEKKIFVVEKEASIGGFRFGKGFAAVMEDGKLTAATSGWRAGGNIYIYRPDVALSNPSHVSAWSGTWESEEDWSDLVSVLEQREITEARRQRRAEKRARKARAALA